MKNICDYLTSSKNLLVYLLVVRMSTNETDEHTTKEIFHEEQPLKAIELAKGELGDLHGKKFLYLDSRSSPIPTI